MATTLHEVIEDIWLEAQDIDSIFRNKKRYMMIKYAKDGLKELQMTFATHIMGINARVPMSCRIYKPDGYEKFLRAYVLDCNGSKIEIKRNNDVPVEIYRYLLNCDGRIMSDGCGVELKDTCLECSAPIRVDDCECCSSCGSSNYLSNGAMEILKTMERYGDSWITTSDRLDYFEFSADLEDEAVVIEYLSNNTAGIDECKIVVEDELREALEYYIKFKLLENGLETMSQAQYYWRKFKIIRDKHQSKENALTKTDLYSVLMMK